MKFNPKLNEWAARLPGFAGLHPMAPDAVAQGTLQLLFELEAILAEISGMDAVTLQPAAGAHGELTGILMIRAYHRVARRPRADRGARPGLVATAPTRRPRRWPASGRSRSRRRRTAAWTSTRSGRRSGPRTAAIMITNPSTLGLFERRIGELLDATHEAGRAGLHGRREPQRDPRPVQAGRGRLRRHALQHPQDVQHAARRRRSRRGPRRRPRPPRPVPARAPRPPRGRRRVPPRGRRASARPRSAGCARSSAAAASSCARTRTCARTASDGLREVSDDAVLAANYLKARVGEAYDIPFDRAVQARVRRLRGGPQAAAPACAPSTSRSA